MTQNDRNEQTEERFHYSFVSPTQEEREEIESIRKQYLPQREGGLERLRKLNARVRRLPLLVAILLAVVGVLVFGGGMSIALVRHDFVVGSIVGAVGILPMALANLAYRALHRAMKKKYGEEILALSEALLAKE